MNKKILLISCILLTLGLCTFIFYDIDNNKNNKVVISNGDSKQLINTNALTMMYEIEIGSGEYQVSSDTTWPQDGYVFNETLSKCENGSILNWDDENKRVVLSTSVSDKCYVYFDVEPDVIYLADYIKSLYTSDGENGLYYHDGLGSYTNASEEAEDNSYRYSGANPNNYVCFGSNAEDCPDDNLYRIIGVFDGQVKLIKSDYVKSDMLGTNGDYNGNYTMNNYGSGSFVSNYKGKLAINEIAVYNWNNVTNTNNWSESGLNTVNLNTNYINYLGNEWADKIETTNWKVGGNTYQNILNVAVKTKYQNEILSPAENTTYSAKIGLMYVSDYGYATSPENWTVISYSDESVRNNNWLYNGLIEWTIFRDSALSDTAFEIYYNGSLVSEGVYDYAVMNTGFNAIRPVFYLKSDVAIEGGTGSMADPYRVY